MILMANALFDKKRKEKIRNALKRGDASVFRRDRPAARELEQDQTATTVLTPEDGGPDAHEETLPRFQPLRRRPGHAPDGDREIDLELIQAAREGDLEGVKDALRRGADVQTTCLVTLMGGSNLDDCQVSIPMTPLEGAEEGGNPEVIELLKKRGAKR